MFNNKKINKEFSSICCHFLLVCFFLTCICLSLPAFMVKGLLEKSFPCPLDRPLNLPEIWHYEVFHDVILKWPCSRGHLPPLFMTWIFVSQNSSTGNSLQCHRLMVWEVAHGEVISHKGCCSVWVNPFKEWGYGGSDFALSCTMMVLTTLSSIGKVETGY